MSNTIIQIERILRKILKKILEKALLVPKVKRGVDEVCRFYATTPIVKEPDTMNFTHYLPHTEERIKRLRRLINKRPVAILLHGSSLKELEERITELANCDICYFSLNSFRVPEKHILQKINRTFSVVLYSAIYTAIHCGADWQINDIVNFLERQEDNIYISEREAFRSLEVLKGLNFDKFFKKYDKKLLFFTLTFAYIMMVPELSLSVPSKEYPLDFPRLNSFATLLSLAIIGEAPLVVIFGGDGGRINAEELYFRECDPTNLGFTVNAEHAERDLMLCTKLFNVVMPLVLEKIYKIYNLKPVDIINCSEQSHYTPFRKLSYDKTFALLKH